MSLYPIIKLQVLDTTNQVQHIYVCNSNSINVKDPNAAFKKNMNNSVFADVFDLTELAIIKTQRIPVTFVPFTIHPDDNVGTIKLKVFEVIDKTVSMDEMYMFCLQAMRINPITLYQVLTVNDRIPLTKPRLEQVLCNIYDLNGLPIDFDSILGEKDKYSFDDILRLDLSEREYLVSLQLGQLELFGDDYPFIANPFLIKKYDTLLEKSRHESSLFNGSLLLNNIPLFRNTIYLCVAQDAFNFFDQLEYFLPFGCKLYFPSLFKQNILTVSDLTTSHTELLENTDSLLTPNILNGFQNIDMFYEIFEKKKPSTRFTQDPNQTGIVDFKVIITPPYHIKLPLDVVFKLIHATEQYPMIKYNPQSKQQNMYRLYTTRLTKDGQKIPYLSRGIITKAIRLMGRSSSISIYSQILYKGTQLIIICEISSNGEMMVYPYQPLLEPIIFSNGPNSSQNFDELIQLALNPIIEEIRLFFEQSGLDIQSFDSIQSPGVEIVNVKYQTNYSIKEMFKLDNYRGCLSSVFSIESTNLEKGAILRFKRVGNFNRLDSQEAFIIDKIEQGLQLEEIVTEFLKNYEDLNEAEASELINQTFQELQNVRGVNRRRQLIIKNNPGFKTTITLNRISGQITIAMDGINSVHYLSTIPIYLNAFMQITQDITKCGIKSTIITQQCKKEEVIDIIFSEELDTESKQPVKIDEYNSTIELDQLLEENDENMDDLLGLLGFEDEEEDQDELTDLSDLGELEVESMSGGAGSDNSKSLSPEDLDDLGEVDELSLSPEDLDENEMALDDIELEQVSSLHDLEDEINEEEEEEEDEEKEEEEKKEKVKERNKVIDITNMKLKYPNPFTARLEAKVPQLFVKSKDEKIDLYSRMCPFSLSDRRQPVILTKEEKDEMIREHPGEINEEADFIAYNMDPSNPNKTYYYTCPRYWCLLTDEMVTEREIMEGKCGKPVDNIEDAIIPKDAATVPKGRYVYQFYDNKESKYPGFHKKNTPDGQCIPCCYNKWSTAEMKNRRDICQATIPDKADKTDKADKSLLPVNKKEKVLEERLKREVADVEHYVIGPEKFPLGEHRWGFLPISVQKFLQQVNEECQISKTNMALKPNHTCILRHGVENSSNQSFIACIASALFYGQRDTVTKAPLINNFIPGFSGDVPSIQQMKEIMITSLSLDLFLRLQNGDLVGTFAAPELDVDLTNSLYTESQLYIKIQTKKRGLTPQQLEQELYFFKKIVQSFENFIEFLRDGKSMIDYVYLWDLICIPNPMLFDAGINLIILEIPEDDVTNNIDLACPTNHYSLHTYDARKRSLILIKRQNYFEPIYSYKNTGKKLLITKTFNEFDKTILPTLKLVFTKIIRPTLGEKCKALPSQPNEYRFKQPPLLDELIEKLIDKGYKVTNQVLNFQGKVIGVLCKSPSGLQGFIPCYPSSLTTLKAVKDKRTQQCLTDSCEYGFVYMTDNIWNSYQETLDFLSEYYKYKRPSNLRLAKCSDENMFCRVVEDEVITGFLTNTNQFVQLSQPIPVSEVDDNIKTISNGNLLIADVDVLTTSKVDSKRVDFIKRVRLETNFYNVFRNTIRILFNDYSNSEQRKIIQEECSKRYLLYNQQLERIIELLHELVDENVVFVISDDIESSESSISDKESKGFHFMKVEEDDIFTCLHSNKDKCSSEDSTSICRIAKDGQKCVLILPKTNLVTGNDNETFYFSRMADELIRYNRVKSFIFKPQAYLSFGQVKYNLRDNEMIILQDLLTQEYFDSLEPADINKYARYNTYDSVEPAQSVPYSNEIVLNPKLESNATRNCFPSELEPIKTLTWKQCFPASFKQRSYKDSSSCSLYMIIDIVYQIQGIQISLNELKELLIHIYKQIISSKEIKDKVIDILYESGQLEIAGFREDRNYMETLIMQESFIPVNFDLWLLLVYYHISTIFISAKPLAETRFNATEFVCYKEDETTKYVFILTPAMYKREIGKFPEYRIIVNDKQEVQIGLISFRNSECTMKIQDAIDKYYSVDDYLTHIFHQEKKTLYRPKKQGIRKLEFIEEEEIDMNPIIKDKKDDMLQEEVIEVKEAPKKRKLKLKAKTILTDDIEPLQEEPEVLKEINPEFELLELPQPILEQKKKKLKLRRKLDIKVKSPGK